MFAGQATHPLALGAHHQRHGAGQLGLIEVVVRLAGGADDPDAALLQLTQGAGQVGDLNERHHFGGATGDLAHYGGQAGGLVPRHYHRMDPGRIGAAQAGAEVVRVSHPIEHQQERLGLLIGQAVQQAGQVVLGQLGRLYHLGHDALVIVALGFIIERLAVHALHLDAEGFQLGQQGLQPVVITALEGPYLDETLRGALKQRGYSVNAVDQFCTHLVLLVLSRAFLLGRLLLGLARPPLSDLPLSLLSLRLS
ncbi:hypothetical protein D3C78_477080 [compost metagenome]